MTQPEPQKNNDIMAQIQRTQEELEKQMSELDVLEKELTGIKREVLELEEDVKKGDVAINQKEEDAINDLDEYSLVHIKEIIEDKQDNQEE